MADGATLAERARGNGAGDGAAGEPPGPFTISGPGLLGALASLGAGAARAGRAVAERVTAPVVDELRGRLTADFDDRDPDYIRDNLPLVWLLTSIWFRGEVRNLGNIPEDRPVLLVGNHSGGNLTPDTHLLTLAFYAYFGVRKGFIRLALNEGVPIVPVVSAGGQETALVLSRGDWLARLLQLDKLFR